MVREMSGKRQKVLMDSGLTPRPKQFTTLDGAEPHDARTT